jgi:heme-degrading monooxygenase HmoA
MFAVLFEVNPRPDQWNEYLNNAKMLRPELEQVEGFVTNIRYGSLTREGWILSFSDWRDEKSLVRWRTMANHHDVQERGRFEILLDYHLRVGQITEDTQLPEGFRLLEQRLDETESGEATTVTLIDAKWPANIQKGGNPEELASYMGLEKNAPRLVSWDVYDTVLNPGNVILTAAFKAAADADAFEKRAKIPSGARVRRVRVVRDYSKYDRHEAPQYYREVEPLPST